MATSRMAGHRLHTEGVRGGLIAECSCGAVYRYDPAPFTYRGKTITPHTGGVFPGGEQGRALIRSAHQAHLARERSET